MNMTRRSLLILDFGFSNPQSKTQNPKSVLLIPQLPLEISFDEPIYVAVEHRGRAGVFVAGAVVFDQRVGVQHVGAYLAAPPGRDVLALEAGVLLGAARFLDLPQSGAQD